MTPADGAATPGQSASLPAPSAAQRRLWFLHQFDEQRAVYNVPVAFHLKGPLDTAALEQALAQVVERHEALRYRFPARDGEPSIAYVGRPFALETADLPMGDRDAFDRFARAEAERPFDLETGPIFRATLVRMGPQAHALLLSLHHIAVDDWSVGILLRDLGAAYDALREGRLLPLPPLRFGFSDHLKREAAEGAAFIEEQFDYWKQQMDGAPALLPLPADHPRPRRQSFAGDRRDFTLPAETADGLRRLSRASGATLFMTGLAAFALLMGRYARQDDIVIGSPMARRTTPEAEGLVGFFVNVLPLRIDLSGAPSFAELVKRARAVMLGAFDNADAPFDGLVEALRPARSPSHTPLFQVMFDVLADSFGGLRMDGLDVEPQPLNSGTAKYDLTVTLKDTPGGLVGAVEYSTDLFEPHTIDRLIGHFSALLAAAAADPDAPIGALSMQGQPEVQALIGLASPDQRLEPGPFVSFPGLFAAAAARCAAAEAIVCGDRRIRYAALDQAASELAGRLRRQGAGPGRPVAAFFDHGPEAVIALLAIHKAGAAFLPVSPDDGRAGDVIADAGPVCILTSRDFAGRAGALGAPVLVLDDGEAESTEEAVAAPGPAPGDLAYLIYTSGSTGRPKGVKVSHGALASAYRAWTAVYDLQAPGLATLQMANFTFDVFIGDVVRTLGSGGKLVMAPREALLEPAHLRGLIEEEAISFAEFVPVVLRQLLAHLEQAGAGLPTLRTLVCGSDVWFIHEYLRARALCAPGARVYGSYGVTEATIDSALFELGDRALALDQIVPLGRPLPNTRLYLLDPDLNLTPTGMTGELVIGGPAVADGYLDRPDLAAARFLTGAVTPGGRLAVGQGADRFYRTGDLCRQGADGTIEFLGRLDHQVKIRGFRIEPGEVESVLADHPDVRECAVVARMGPGGEAELVGYVRGDASVAELRTHLRRRLPSHMVPAFLTALAAFPLSANGKIDRNALPAPDREAAGEAKVTPRDALETEIAAIWARLLGIGDVGVHDDFFARGGNSLMAARLAARLRDRFGVRLPLSQLFDGPTVAQLALAVTGAPADAAPEAPIPPAAGVERRRLSQAQLRLWLATRTGVDAAYNVPDALRLRGPLDVGALTLAIGDVIARHETLRSRFSAGVETLILADGQRIEEPVVDIAPPGETALTIVPASHGTLAALLHDEASRPFDMAAGPPIRAMLFALGPGEHVLLVTIHHIVCDGASAPLVWRELAAFYEARLSGVVPRLAPLAVQYADHAAWQRRRSETEGAHPLDYWLNRLSDLPPPLDLPARRLGGAAPSDAGATLDFALSPRVMARLNDRARAWQCTPFMVMHAAFAILLHRYTGQDDIVLGAPTSGRRHPDAEPIIGFFVNMLALRLPVRGGDSVDAVVRRARQACLEAFEHQDAPFEQLVERLSPERQPGRHAIFQVGLAWQEAGPAVTLPGLVASPEPVALDRAKLDLTLGVGGETASFSYRTDLFDQASIEHMRDHFLALLSAMAEDPGQTVSALSMLSDDERRRQLHTWNDTVTPWLEAATTLHGLFEAQARSAPDRVALQLGARRWSYGSLDRMADQVAAALIAAGVRPGAAVGLLAGRHPHLVAGMLGILKAGAAYVPLDPDDPGGRTRHVMRDAGLTAVVVGGGLETAAAALGLPVVTVEDGAADAAFERPAVAPGDRAYVIYTSGSTGRPKGVAVSQGAIRNTVLGFVRRMGLDPAARLLQFFSPVFDGAGCEIFPVLAAGGTLVFGRRDDLSPGAPLADLLAHEHVTHLLITPSALQLLPERPLDDLRVIMVAGEPCPPAVAQRWAIGRRFLNGYGPTETAVCASATDYWDERGRMVLRPLENITLDVLDRAGALLPVGAPGELCIGGAGLAEGYLGQEALTAAAFIADPNRPGQRLYRTGDRVRRLADGAIEFLGRTDRQVKIRGFRIELDEVAAALAALPGVTEAAAIARPDRHGQKQLIAYLAGSLDEPQAMAAARRALPAAMVPSRIVRLPVLPKTEAGKIDHRALPPLTEAEALPAPAEGAPRSDEAQAAVAAFWREVLDRSDIGLDENFFDAGGNSLRLAMLHKRLAEGFAKPLTLTDLFQHPTVRGMARFLSGAAMDARPAPASPATGDAIAIIGMAGRFPGAADIETFWDNLRDGVDVTTLFSKEELIARGADPEALKDPAFVRAGLPLEHADRFDAGFFGFSPKEAQITDPQHRLFLQSAWTAMEAAGYGDTAGGARSVGVFAACNISHYLLDHIHPRRRELKIGAEQWVLGNDKDFIATRTAYKLDLRGPAMTVETACSSSLTAVHLACESLRRGECGMALAGGVSIDAERMGYVPVEGGILSAGGFCRPFDAAADGTMSGSGVAVVLLKPLAAALADGDAIHAVIRGSALNNDGADKVSYTAPSVEGQAQVVRRALEAAGIGPESIAYVEAHGTGTRLGDPIEVRALALAFAGADRQAPCLLGSVKSNVGHLDAAAGVAGLVKTALALEHGLIPASLHFTDPNPEIGFADGSFVVAASARPWPQSGPRRAGVSSFGVGGTNVHAVLEAAPERAALENTEPGAVHVLPLSARTPAALKVLADDLADHLSRHDVPLADVAYTLQVGRTRFGLRTSVTCRTAAEAVALLRGAPERAVAERRTDRPVVFLFPGQGSQHLDMGRGLYETNPVFRGAFDRCADILAGLLDLDIRTVVHPSSEDRAATGELLARTRYAQPALFAVEYALAQTLMQAGVRPQAMLGHSLGEYVAACLSGFLTLEDALHLVVRRATLMQAAPGGAMTAVQGGEEDVRPYLAHGVEIAAFNSAAQTVLSGAVDAIERVERACREQGRPHRRLHTSHAFHSALMQEAADGLRTGSPPGSGAAAIPFVSNRSGAWFGPADAADPDYWAEHLRRPVRFSQGLETVAAEGDPILLEVGPGRTLQALLAGRTVVSCLPHARETSGAAEAFAECLAGLWRQGAAIDWQALHPVGARRRVRLPTYPFARDRHWIASVEVVSAGPVLVRHWRKDGPDRTIVTLAMPLDHWMVDEHRVFGDRPTLPGTGCLELARAAFARVRGVERMEFSDVYFAAPLVLADGEDRDIRLLLTERGERTEFTLQSRVGHDAWQDHAQGLVREVAAEADPPATFTAPGDLGEPVEPAVLEAALAAYGPRWRCFEQVRCSDDEGWARLRLDDAFTADCQALDAHPALLDMATAFLSLHTRLRDGDRRDLAPFHYRRLTLLRPLPPALLSHARRVGRDAYDIDLYAEGGDGLELVARIERYTLREAAGGPRAMDQWCEVPGWRPQPADGAPDGRPWLVFADAFEGAPEGSIMVGEGAVFERLTPFAYRLRPGSLEDHAALLAELMTEGRLPDHIVHGWAMDAEGSAMDGFERLMALVKPLGAAVREPMLLSLLTRGMAGLPDDPAGANAAGAAGLLRTVGWEFPAIACRQIDVGAEHDPDALIAELSRRPAVRPPHNGTLVALRDGERLVPAYRTLDAGADAAPLRPGAAYLITGGLGGVGLALARHIAETAPGARLALVTRQERPSAALDAVRAIAEVMVIEADVGDGAQVVRAVDLARARFGPIKGVIHAAGLEASGLIETADAEAWRAVMAPKTLGADALVAAVAPDTPDFILLCSSLAATVGGLGQGDYAAANLSMETAAGRWRAEGLPVTALAWDAWAEVGMLAAHERRRGRDPDTVRGLTVAEGLRLFDRARGSAEPVILVSKWAPVEALLQTRGAAPAAGSPAPSAAGRIAPRTETETDIAGLWEELLGVRAPGVEDNFFDLGGHSLLGTQLISRLRERFDHSLTLAEFLEEPTIARIARSVSSSPSQPAAAIDADVRFCLVPVETRGGGKPFFCLPGMGGNVAQMLPLAAALGGDRPFYGLQCLGLDGQRDPHESVEAMADHYIRCIKSVQPQGPYLLGGHSLGGKVAYEMAHRLHAAGDRVAHLALFDSAAPPYLNLAVPDDAQVLFTLLSIFGFYFGKTVELGDVEHKAVAALPMEAKIALLQERLEAYGLVRPGSDPGAIRGLFRVYQAAGRFGSRYLPQHPPIPAPMTLYKAMDPMPPGVALPEIRETAAWGWEALSLGPVAIQETPGNHFSCLTPDHVQPIADRLRRDLALADAQFGAAA